MKNKRGQQLLEVKNDGKFAYNIILESGFGDLEKFLREAGCEGRRICIVTDSNVEKLYLKEVEEIASKTASEVISFVFKAGESSKTLDTVQELYTRLIEAGFDRQDYLLALGGGVTGDLTGFTAATYLRGIRFIQVPTTLLSQVDSSIGGKTGVDFASYKNMVGAFHMPSLVYINEAVLSTLPDDQFACGMGEVLKSGLIRDADFYEWTINHMGEIDERDPGTLLKMEESCCRIKRDVVEADPYDRGERAILNFGHTLGHAIEKLKNFSLTHGECVALGMVAAAYISWKRGYLDENEFYEIRDMNVGFYLPISFDGLDCQEILDAAGKDKKRDGKTLKFILLEKPGKAMIADDVTEAEMLDALKQMKAEF